MNARARSLDGDSRAPTFDRLEEQIIGARLKSSGCGRHYLYMATLTRVFVRVIASCLAAAERFLDARAEAFSEKSWI
jgi:hypothetical protein